MLHDFLAVGLLVALASIYFDTHARDPIVQAVRADWSPSAMRRGKMNGIMASCSIGLTSSTAGNSEPSWSSIALLRAQLPQKVLLGLIGLVGRLAARPHRYWQKRNRNLALALVCRYDE
jgi:hypothetical protein